MPSNISLSSRRFVLWLHTLIWLAFFLVPLLFIDDEVRRLRYIYLGWGLQFLMMLFFYLNYLVLIPRLLLRRRIGRYLLFLLLSITGVCLVHTAFIYASYGIYEHRHPFDFWRAFNGSIYPSLFILALSSAIRITNEWFKNERQRKEMKEEQMASELAFLKSQINPHFLFNILNNICSLARKKSDDTEDAIIRLSQIMRYMLQDSRNDKVSLGKEVDYLKSYIELQQLRISSQVNIEFIIEGEPEEYQIEPLLLIPFVENAFKHGISYHEASDISIKLTLSPGTIRFTVKNRILPSHDTSLEAGSGIGLKNVTRRLDLLYPNRHKLTISTENNQYLTILTINNES